MNSSAIDIDLLVRRAFESARGGDLQGAAQLCAEVLRLDRERPEAWLLHAVVAMRSGNPAEALDAARRALPTHPARAAIHALIGDALLQLHDAAAALENYETALQIEPGLASALCGRGDAQLALGRPGDAAASFDALLDRQPDDVEALVKRGHAQFQLRDLAAALGSYDRALALRPGSAEVQCNRGAVLLLLLRTEEALRCFDDALAVAPDFAEAHHHRGQALRLLSRPAQALAAFESAVRARPDYADALVGRGSVLLELKRPTQALQSFELARSLEPGSPAAQRGVGDALLDLGQAAAALAAHDAAVRLGTDLAESLRARGNSLRALRRYPEAIAAYDDSLRLDARNATTLCDKAHTLLQWGAHVAEAVDCYASALALNSGIPFVPGTLLYAQMRHADWSVRLPAASRERILDAVRDGTAACAPFAFLSISDDAAAQRRCAEIFTRQELGAALPSRSRPRYGHARIRVAYVSADLREHAVSYLLAGVLERHDRERFETYGIALRPAEESPTGTRVRAAFQHFVDVSAKTDREVMELMRSLEIDIAVDLTGYTQGFRPQILALGAAPIQVGYLGFPGTMGAPFVDYLVADDFVVPAGRRCDYAEAIAYLPECFQANDDRRVISERRFTRAEQGLPHAAFVFCCLNNSHKINERMFDVWMSMLARVPHAVLWLLCHEPEVRGNLRREAAQRHVDPERLVFAERLPYAEHLARLQLADLFLDTLPFNAGATASDALWAGVPVLTCAGDAFAARMAGSLLRAVGLPELIAPTLEDYEAQAVRFAAEPRRLAAVRERLAVNRRSAPLFDTARFTLHLEAAYREMWRRHEHGEQPSTLTVSPIATPPRS